MNESIIQARFIKIVKEKNLGIAVKVNCASMRGWPDVTFVDFKGDVNLVEFKAKNGSLTPHQKGVHADLFKLNCVVVVLSSVDEVDDYIRLLEREYSFGKD